MSLPMQGGRSGGVQFDFAGLKAKLLNLCLRQNSFKSERFTRERASVEHLKSSLLVRVGNSSVQWPMVWPLNGDQPAHGTHSLNSPAEVARFANRRQLIIALNIIELEFVAINLAVRSKLFPLGPCEPDRRCSVLLPRREPESDHRQRPRTSQRPEGFALTRASLRGRIFSVMMRPPDQKVITLPRFASG